MAWDAKKIHDRILGCLVAAGMGDAIGAPSEAMSQKEIRHKFGGYITTFEDVGDNPYALGNDLGEVTDDASQMYEMAKAVIRTQGNLTVQAAADAIVNWSKSYPKYYPRNAGPTTSYVISELLSGADPVEVGKTGGVYGRGVSNGAAMRVAAAGLVYPGDLDRTVQIAITMTKPTHGTQHAYAGACAIACGISQALSPHSDIFSIIKAAYYGAEKGELIGIQEARQAPGASILPKILAAANCALYSATMPELLDAIEYEVGNDGAIQVSVPAAIGLFAGVSGEPMATILAAANLGGDSDTIACIAGMLAGAYKGFSAIPADMYRIFKASNPLLDFESVSTELTKIVLENIKE